LRKPILQIVLLFILLALSVGYGFAQDEPIITRSTPPDPTQYQLTEVVSGLSKPLYLTHAGDGSGRLFIVEQTGAIWVMQDGVVLSPPFLDLSNIINQDIFNRPFSERGLLGLAFHPNYAENGQFFVHYNDASGTTIIARYHVSADNPNIADPQSAQLVLMQSQPFANHNGGQIAFGPDGFLYIGLGDGGAAGDPQNNGQNPSTLLGTILRIDVDNGERYAVPADNPFVGDTTAADEVWAWGLRNPWRFSFDRATGDLYIADVGQNQWEEINFQAANSLGGENYGWNILEGNHNFSGGTPPSNAVAPILEYNHSSGISVTGGYVYRGSALPDLDGVYFYGDWGSGVIWAAYRDQDNRWQTNVFMNTNIQISSFGEDENGELFVLDYGGRVFQLTAASGA